MPRNYRRTSTLATAPAPPGKDRRRISRRERERQQRRYLTIGMIAVAALVAVIALVSSLNYFVLEPNGTIASINGQNITRADYWKVRRNVLLDRLQQYQLQSQLGQGSSQQLQAGADAARLEIRGIRTYPPDPTTVQQMVEDRVILDALPTLGVTLSDQEVNETVAERFAPVRLNTPTPEPTLNPTRQATAAAATAGATITAQAISAGATATVGFVATQTATASALTPTANTPPTATVPPSTTPVPSQTPTNGEARATSTAVLGEFIKSRQQNAEMSLDDYKRLIIRPALARQRTREVLEARAPSRGEQVRASHILVPTEEAAREARRRVVEGGQGFGAVAMELSTDTSTKPNGGDLGYAPRGVYVKPFEDAAFSLPVNTVSEPVKTEFGFHIIKVVDHPADREFDDAVFRQVRDKQFQSWVTEQTQKARITQTLPTPIPTPQPGFQPPAGAPATPTYTPAPTAPVGSPPAAAPTAPGTPGSAAIPGVTTVPGVPGVPGAAGAAGAGGAAPTPMGGAATVAGTPASAGAAPVAATVAAPMQPATTPTVPPVAAPTIAPAVTAPPAAAPTVAVAATAPPVIATVPAFTPPTIVPPTAIPPLAIPTTAPPAPPAPPTVAPVPTAPPAISVPTIPPPPTVALPVPPTAGP